MTSIITRADRARDIRQWQLAARLYRKALNRNPKNPPIWLQYGHALKEAGKSTEAERAYRIAIRCQPGDADAHLHLGHVLKLQGKRCEAEAAYLRALAIDPRLPEPLEELRRLGWSDAHLAELNQADRPNLSDRDEVTAPVTSPPAPEPEPLHPRTGSDVDPMLWFFVGDTIEWLQAHEQLTGVGRVTVELFFASLDRDSEHHAFPCVLDKAAQHLVSVSLSQTASYLASRVGTPAVADLIDADQSGTLPEPSRSPRSGDHVVFTGVVWTPAYRDLFRRLSRSGISFSVLVYDVIPIERPDLVGQQYHEMFRDWLETTITSARAIFVSSAMIKDQLLEWAAISEVEVAATIIPISFGFREIANALSYDELKASAATSRVKLGSFVLSVGTVDKRKNQALLCRLWQRLVSDLGGSQVPQLALVGREDLTIADLDEGIASLVKTSRIVVLQGLSDAELAGLYRQCLFTAFPSLSEGYGLPVAESLQHGKLCISSDLAVIREHAGDLPWYFNPADDTAAYHLLRRAIEDADARTAAEQRIARLHRPCTWASTYRAIANAAFEDLATRTRSNSASIQSYLPVVPGTRAAAMSMILTSSEQWCTECDPAVSIVIVNCNAGQLTCECVRRIWANTDGPSYEIIIADNGSNPGDIAPLRTLGHNVRLLELGTNRFFGEASNIAAESAKGQYLCFLDNMAFVQQGWLQSLVDAFQHTPAAGAVGPCLLFPDNHIKEAGAAINEAGYPVHFARGQSADLTELFTPRYADYVSAATLLLTRELFVTVGGFDLAYEPGSYEDIDLCLKIRAVGLKVHYCPEAKVILGAAPPRDDNPVAESRRKALDDLNRGKFTSRWGWFLKSRSEADLERVRRSLPRYETDGRGHTHAQAAKKTAALFTPFALTPGGGERYLLTLASALAPDYKVTIVTPHPYSQLRLLNLGREFCVDLGACKLMTEKEFLSAPRPDFMVTLGNHVIAPIAAQAKTNIYICQFPFPMPLEEVPDDVKRWLSGYRSIIAYSEYAKAHILAKLSRLQLPARPIQVVYPPVPSIGGDSRQKKSIILSVGRFFTGGHGKRHDLMISAFRALVERSGAELELHLAGSSVPHPEHMDYLNQLREMSQGLPVVFHVNAPSEELVTLYRDAAVYWQGTGLEADLDLRPEDAEHFGISIVEAMSAQCVAMAVNAGGPREFITHGVDGFLYQSQEELAELTCKFFREEFRAQRQAIGRAASRRAAAFSPRRFIDKVRDIASLSPDFASSTLTTSS